MQSTVESADHCGKCERAFSNDNQYFEYLLVPKCTYTNHFAVIISFLLTIGCLSIAEQVFCKRLVKLHLALYGFGLHVIDNIHQQC